MPARYLGASISSQARQFRRHATTIVITGSDWPTDGTLRHLDMSARSRTFLACVNRNCGISASNSSNGATAEAVASRCRRRQNGPPPATVTAVTAPTATGSHSTAGGPAARQPSLLEGGETGATRSPVARRNHIPKSFSDAAACQHAATDHHRSYCSSLRAAT